MPIVHRPDGPENIPTLLRPNVRRHDRVLLAELLEILTALARQENPTRSIQAPALVLHFSEAAPDTNWSREEIYRDDDL